MTDSTESSPQLIQEQFDNIKEAYFESFRTTRNSILKNTLFFRKYNDFKESKKLPTNLQFRRVIFNYSTAWNKKEIADMIDSENLIVLKAQYQLLSLRIIYYYEMITRETTLLHNLLKTQNITYHFQKECPELINYQELYNNSYNEINIELATHYLIPELSEEEKLEQFYALSRDSPPLADDPHKRKRNDTDEDRLVRPSTYHPSINLFDSSSSTSLSSSSSSSIITNHTQLQDITPHKTTSHSILNTNKNKNRVKHANKDNLSKSFKNNTTSKEIPTVFDLSSTPTSKSITNKNINNIKIISDQLSSLKNAVESLISNNQNIKNDKILNPNIKKKNNSNNSPQTKNIKNTITNNPLTTKRYNQNQNINPPPFHLQQIAPTLNLQPPYLFTQQPRYQTYTQQHSIHPFNYNNDNNQYHPHFHLPTQHYINYDQNIIYEAKNHLHPQPHHG